MSRTQNIWRYIYLMSIYLFTGGVAIGSSKLCSECETSRKPADSERRVRFLLHDSHPPTTMPTTDVTTTHQPDLPGDRDRPAGLTAHAAEAEQTPAPSVSVRHRSPSGRGRAPFLRTRTGRRTRERVAALPVAGGERPPFLPCRLSLGPGAGGAAHAVTRHERKGGPTRLGFTRNLTAEIHLLLSLTRGAGFRGPPSLSVGAHGGLGRVNGTEKGRRAGGSRARWKPSRTGAKPAGSFEPTTAVQ